MCCSSSQALGLWREQRRLVRGNRWRMGRGLFLGCWQGGMGCVENNLLTSHWASLSMSYLSALSYCQPRLTRLN